MALKKSSSRIGHGRPSRKVGAFYSTTIHLDYTFLDLPAAVTEVVGSPTLSTVPAFDTSNATALFVDPYAVGSPVLGAPNLISFITSPITVGSPVFTTPNLIS